MTLIEYIRELFKTCPLLADGRINVDFLDASHGSYSINTAPSDPIVSRYVNGDTRRQFTFEFASAEWYGAEIRQNLENVGFWEELADWIETVELPKTYENEEHQVVPILDGKEPQEMQILTSGYAFMTEADAARYQIECRLIYRQKG